MHLEASKPRAGMVFAEGDAEKPKKIKNVAAQKSTAAWIRNAKLEQKTYSAIWNLAEKSPVYSKKVELESGKVIRRKSRLISNHAFNTAVSGSHAMRMQQTNKFLETYGKHAHPESASQPATMKIREGAKLIIERALCYFVQRAITRAKGVKESCNKHKRLNRKLVEMAFKNVKSEAFAGKVPSGSTFVLSAPSNKKRKGKKITNEKMVQSEAQDVVAADMPPLQATSADATA